MVVGVANNQIDMSY